MNKKFTILYIVLAIVSTSLAGYFFSFSIQHPYIGAVVETQNEQYKIIETEPNTWASRHLQRNDVVLEINGSHPSFSEPISKWGILEQADSIKVKNHKTGKVKTLHAEPTIDMQMVFQLIIPSIVFILILFCTYSIFKGVNTSTQKSSWYLILFLFDIAVAYITAGASTKGEWLARSIVTILFALVPVFYLHFVYLYFKELNSVWFSKKWIAFCYVLVIFNSLVNILTLYPNSPFNLGTVFVKTFNLLSFMVVFLLSSVLITMGLKKIRFKYQKYVIKVLILTNVMAFAPFILLYILPYILIEKQIFSPVILSGFLLIIPFSLVYQSMATKMYDIEFIAGKVRYYIFLSVLPSLIGILLIIFMESDNAMIFLWKGFGVLLFSMILAFYLKEFVEHKLNVSAWSGNFSFQDDILDFTKKLHNSNNLQDVIVELKNLVINRFLVNECFSVLVYKDEIERITPENDTVFKYKNEIIQATSAIGTIVEIDKGFIFSIGESNGTSYVLVFLSKFNIPKLSRDKVSLLKTLIYYTEITIDSFLKVEQLMENLKEIENEGKDYIWLNRVMYQLEEKQRSALAKDLHDSVLQDLLSIKRKLEIDDYSLVTSSSEHASKKELILNDLIKVIDTTRETCNELRPNLLFDLGLEKAVKKLVEKHIERDEVNIRFTSNKIDGELPSEIQINFYRIIQELLNNSKKHSHAKNIVVMLVKIKDKIVLHYQDDGVGTDLKQLFSKEGGLGFSGVKERVKMLNGTLEVDTAINQGFKVNIEI